LALKFLDFSVNEKVTHHKLIAASVLNTGHKRGKDGTQRCEETTQVSQEVKQGVDASEVL